jgi:cytoskeletal protein RodZ
MVNKMLLNTGETYTPEQADIIAWQRTYQAVNVEQELMAMESWLDANPTRRKTAKGIKRFINSWLARAQDRGGSPQAKNLTNRLRNKTVDMQLADVSWIDYPATKENMKTYYINKLGFYYDGEIKTA